MSFRALGASLGRLHRAPCRAVWYLPKIGDAAEVYGSTRPLVKMRCSFPGTKNGNAHRHKGLDSLSVPRYQGYE